MFSNDQNIETISQLVESLKEYAGLQTEYIKLSAVEKTVRLLTALTMVAVLSLLLVLTLIFLSIAVGKALSLCVPGWVAYLIVTVVYLFLFLLAIIFRKRWIERPLVRFLAGLLMEK